VQGKCPDGVTLVRWWSRQGAMRQQNAETQVNHLSQQCKEALTGVLLYILQNFQSWWQR
jgi:hypothetical protein